MAVHVNVVCRVRAAVGIPHHPGITAPRPTQRPPCFCRSDGRSTPWRPATRIRRVWRGAPIQVGRLWQYVERLCHARAGFSLLLFRTHPPTADVSPAVPPDPPPRHHTKAREMHVRQECWRAAVHDLAHRKTANQRARSLAIARGERGEFHAKTTTGTSVPRLSWQCRAARVLPAHRLRRADRLAMEATRHRYNTFPAQCVSLCISFLISARGGGDSRNRRPRRSA